MQLMTEIDQIMSNFGDIVVCWWYLRIIYSIASDFVLGLATTNRHIHIDILLCDRRDCQALYNVLNMYHITLYVRF